MSAEADPINSYQLDGMSKKARRRRARQHPANRGPVKTLDRRPLPARPEAGRQAPKTVGPTPERLAKPDAPALIGCGLYRAPMPIERMRDQERLAPGDPQQNEAMYLAAEKLVGLFEGAGLATTVRAQDLTRVVGDGGDAGDEHAAHCLLEFRRACTLMGWSVAHPYRGAGRITVAVVCFGQSLKEAAALHRPGGGDAAQLAAGKEALQTGLYTLALHWRLLHG